MLTILNEERTISNWIGTINPDTKRVGIYLSVKGDREERPDIDSVYMTVCQAFTGSGGWPMSVFMTWDKKPFFAGTYFPPTPRFGMPSFRDVLNAVTMQWGTEREK